MILQYRFMMVLNILRITSINKIHDEKEAVGLNQNDSEVLLFKGEEYENKTQRSLLTKLITTTLVFFVCGPQNFD